MKLSKIIKNLRQSSKKKKQIKPKQQNNQILLTQFLSIIKENDIFQSSGFYTEYLQIMVRPMILALQDKFKAIKQQQKKEQLFSYQKKLMKIKINISSQEGIFYAIINLWVSYCDFKMKEIVLDEQQSQLERSKNILNFFQREYFMLCFYLYKLCPIIFGNICEKPQNEQLLTFIRNEITQCRKLAIVHNHIIKNVVNQAQPLDKKQIEQNMNELDKLCKVSQIPIPFFDCLDIIKQFYRQHILNDKIKIACKLFETIRALIGQYRYQNGLKGQYLISADDMFSVLAYLLWRVNRNIYGACVYIQAILCSQYKEINPQIVANQLQKFGPDTRHSFQTIKSVSYLGLIPQQLHKLL